MSAADNVRGDIERLNAVEHAAWDAYAKHRATCSSGCTPIGIPFGGRQRKCPMGESLERLDLDLLSVYVGAKEAAAIGSLVQLIGGLQ